MSVYAPKDYQWAYREESSHYAQGDDEGDPAVHSCTAFSAGDVARLKSAPFPMDGNVFPMKLYDREKVRGSSYGADKVNYWNKGQKYTEFTTKTYIQSNVFMNVAFGTVTQGTIPSSFVWHFEGDGDHFDVCGAVIQEYTIDLPEGIDFPSEEIKWFYYDVVDSNAVTNFFTTTGAMFLTSPVPKIKKDISISIGGVTLNEITSAKATVKFEFKDQPIASRLQHFDPYVLSRDFTLEVTAYVDNASLKLIPTTASPAANKTVIITIDSWTLNVTNCEVDATNLGEVPGKDDFKKWKFTVTNAGDSAYSTT